MINRMMRNYDYFLFNAQDAYGQLQLSEKIGSIKMCIASQAQRVQDNVLYQGAEYVGLTMDAAVSDKYVIDYMNTKLKVLYVNPFGRYKQVFMSRM